MNRKPSNASQNQRWSRRALLRGIGGTALGAAALSLLAACGPSATPQASTPAAAAAPDRGTETSGGGHHGTRRGGRGRDDGARQARGGGVQRRRADRHVALCQRRFRQRVDGSNRHRVPMGQRDVRLAVGVRPERQRRRQRRGKYSLEPGRPDLDLQHPQGDQVPQRRSADGRRTWSSRCTRFGSKESTNPWSPYILKNNESITASGRLHCRLQGAQTRVAAQDSVRHHADPAQELFRQGGPGRFPCRADRLGSLQVRQVGAQDQYGVRGQHGVLGRGQTPVGQDHRDTGTGGSHALAQLERSEVDIIGNLSFDRLLELQEQRPSVTRESACRRWPISASRAPS